MLCFFLGVQRGELAGGGLGVGGGRRAAFSYGGSRFTLASFHEHKLANFCLSWVLLRCGVSGKNCDLFPFDIY